MKKSAIRGREALSGDVFLERHQWQNTDHLDWYNWRVDILFGLAILLAAAVEKPLCLIADWIASTRVDSAPLVSGGIGRDAAALVVSSILEALLGRLLAALTGRQTIPVGANLGLSGLAASLLPV